MSVIQQLREIVATSDQSQNDIAKATGVPQPTLSKFLTGKRGLRIGDFDKLAAHFGLTLQPADPAASAKKVKPAVPAVDWSKAEPKKTTKRRK